MYTLGIHAEGCSLSCGPGEDSWSGNGEEWQVGLRVVGCEETGSHREVGTTGKQDFQSS